MVEGIINAFDHMELCLVIKLTKGGNWAIYGHQYWQFATGLLVLLLPFIPGSKHASKYLLPAKQFTFIFNTALCRKLQRIIVNTVIIVCYLRRQGICTLLQEKGSNEQFAFQFCPNTGTK